MSSFIERRKKLIVGLDALLTNFGMKNFSPFRTEIAKAYDAPFPDPSYKMGPRAMPSQVPTMPDDPSLEAQRKAWEFFENFEKPFLCAFSDNDPITRGLDKKFIATCPGAKGQPHSTVQRGGHFIQEKRPKEISKIISDFIKLTITESSE